VHRPRRGSPRLDAAAHGRAHAALRAFDRDPGVPYRFCMREFIYGVILGAATLYAYKYFDAPGIFAYLNNATASAVKSTSGYSNGSPYRTPHP
jgi:hypothetical protein